VGLHAKLYLLEHHLLNNLLTLVVFYFNRSYAVGPNTFGHRLSCKLWLGYYWQYCCRRLTVDIRLLLWPAFLLELSLYLLSDSDIDIVAPLNTNPVLSAHFSKPCQGERVTSVSPLEAAAAKHRHEEGAAIPAAADLCDAAREVHLRGDSDSHLVIELRPEARLDQLFVGIKCLAAPGVVRAEIRIPTLLLVHFKNYNELRLERSLLYNVLILESATLTSPE